MVTILLAEDHKIVRNGIKSLLEKETGFQIINEAGNGKEVIKKLEENVNPDIIIMDMNMPEMNGLETLKYLSQHFPQNKVLILSMLDHENYVVEAMRTGAKGYILKNAHKEELIFAIEYVQKGGKYLCSEISLKILEKCIKTSPTFGNREKKNIDISKRESEVLKLIAEGYTNSEIASKLFTSRRTIETHRKNLIEKTGSKNTATLIRFAIFNGIIQ